MADAAAGPPTIDSERFEDLEPAWLALHEQSGATPFAHPAWVRAWVEQRRLAADIVYLAVRRSGELIGVAPLAMAPGTARFAGEADVFDYSPLLAAPGEEMAVVLGALEWLREDMTPELMAWGLPADGLPGELAEAAGDLGWETALAPEAVAPRVELPGDFEGYLAALTKKDRHETRRKVRNVEALDGVAFEEARDGDAFATALETLLAMMRASHPGKGAFLDEYGAFFRAGVAALAEAGIAVVSTLSVAGEPAASTLTFESGRTSYLYNSGYHPLFESAGVGLVSKVFALRSAAERGFAAFDFLRGEEEYKFRMGGVPREIVTASFRQR